MENEALVTKGFIWKEMARNVRKCPPRVLAVEPCP